MNNDEKDIEFISKYIEGSLSPQEMLDFEERLHVDEKFDEKYRAYKDLIEGIKHSGRNKLLQSLKVTEASIVAQETADKKILGVSTRYFYTYSAAATVVLLIAFTFIFLVNHKPSSSEIYSDYFSPYQNIVHPATRGDVESETEVERAYRHYDHKEYDLAVKAFEKVTLKDPSPDALLYLANSYMALNNFDSAIEKLGALTAMESSFSSQAHWYLGLCYLAKNDLERAKDVLNRLKDKEGYYSKKASRILKEIP